MLEPIDNHLRQEALRAPRPTQARELKVLIALESIREQTDSLKK